MLSRISQITLLSAVSVLGTTSFSLALDGLDFGQKLTAYTAQMGLTMNYGSLTTNGQQVKISDFSFSADQDDTVSLPLTLVFDDVREAENGSYYAGKVILEDADFKIEETRLIVKDAFATNFYIPGSTTGLFNDIKHLVPYAFSQVGNLSVEVDGKKIVDVSGITSINEMRGEALFARSHVEAVDVNLKAVDDPEVSEFIKALGKDVVTLSGSVEGTWFLQSGVIDMTDWTIDFKDFGVFKTTMKLGGYTLDFYKDAMKANAKMESARLAGVDVDDAQTEELLRMYADALELHNFKFNYVENGLVSAALRIAGQAQGIDADTMKMGLKFMVPMMLSELPSSDVLTQAQAAFNVFIDDPKSLTIEGQPNEPLTFKQIEALGDSFDEIAKVLNLKITANN